MHRFTLILAAIAITMGLVISAAAPGAAQRGQDPAAQKRELQQRRGKPTSSKVIPGQYIIKLKGDVSTARVETSVKELARGFDLDVIHVYGRALKGFAAKVPPGRVNQLRKDPRVASIEPDREAKAFAETFPTGVNRIGADDVTEGVKPVAPDRTGQAVAVLDSGIDKHKDLNVRGGFNAVGSKSNCTAPKSGAWGDGNGHGTHVAGTIGAKQNTLGVVGVAPGTPLWAVRVLNNNGSGSFADIICGIEWVIAHHNDVDKQIKVVNMSLGGSCYPDDGCSWSESSTNCAAGLGMHQAICNLNATGVKIVVAAGNDAENAVHTIPAMYDPHVTTVSALTDTDGCRGAQGQNSIENDLDDTLAFYSNYGTVVDVAAPGTDIRSTWKAAKGDKISTKYKTISGTSIATPHVAAAMALGWNGSPTESDPDPDGVWDDWAPGGSWPGIPGIRTTTTRR